MDQECKLNWDKWLYFPVTMTYCSRWQRDSFRQPAVNSLCSLTCLTFPTVQLPQTSIDWSGFRSRKLLLASSADSQRKCVIPALRPGLYIKSLHKNTTACLHQPSHCISLHSTALQALKRLSQILVSLLVCSTKKTCIYFSSGEVVFWFYTEMLDSIAFVFYKNFNNLFISKHVLQMQGHCEHNKRFLCSKNKQKKNSL